MTNSLGMNHFVLSALAAIILMPPTAWAANGYGGAGTSGYGARGGYQQPPGPFSGSAYGSSYRGWGGTYIGGFVGGTWSSFDKDTTIGASGDDSAVIGGLNLGFNAPMRGFVLGAEADIASVDNRKRTGGYKYTQNWTSTFRGRLGFEMDQVLPYVTAGFALTDTEQNLSGVGKTGSLEGGIAAGGGVDIMVHPRWFARVEYLYVDVPTNTKTLGGVPVSGGSGNNTLKFGLNYKF